MRIGFIGAGKLAAAIARGVIRAGVAKPDEVIASARTTKRRDWFASEVGVTVTDENAAVVGSSEVVILSTKPQDLPPALSGIAHALGDRLLISVAAGVRLADLQDLAGPSAALARVMPNTPALVGKGAAAYALGETANAKHAKIVETIFGAVGDIHVVKEELLDAVLGVSGSGPAYVLLMIEALSDGGVLMGLPRPLAMQLAVQTVAGAAELVRSTGQHPAILREAVTSPNGTTAAALEVLEKAAFRSAVQAAVRAATERSRELGRQ
jgi:pyrroline-5-carboxylate reductase